MITVISKHLSLLTRIPFADGILLKNIHLIELLRYRCYQLQIISDREIGVPQNFETGLDIKDEGEISHLYRFMCLWFELETIVKTGRSFLDHFWRSIIRNHKAVQELDDIKNGKYLSQTMNELNKKENCAFKSSKTYKQLYLAWLSWGSYLIRFRNYLEYEQPLGGMLQKSVGSIIQTNNHIDIIIPDNFPFYGENVDNYIFTFNKNKKAIEFATEVIQGIDNMFPEIIKDNT